MQRTDTEIRRESMVRDQIIQRGIRDSRVIEAMRRVPRHLFVPPKIQDRAYEDRPLPIGKRQTISQPYIVALMTELLNINSKDKILEVGTGSGYQAAVLSLLASQVVSVERRSDFAEGAKSRLAFLGYCNIEVLECDGTLGYPDHAPYNAIVVTAGGPKIPESLKEQLTMGGRLLCPVGTREHQELHLLTRTETGYSERKAGGCVFVPLIGDDGWHEDTSR